MNVKRVEPRFGMSLTLHEFEGEDPPGIREDRNVEETKNVAAEPHAQNLDMTHGGNEGG